MKKSFFIVVFTTICSFFAHAQQDLKSTIGLRLPLFGGIGLTYKKYKSENTATELYLSYHKVFLNTYELGYTRQAQFAITEVAGLHAYVGGGLVARMISVGSEVFKNAAYGSIGVTAIGGAEYRIAKLPLIVSLDWMPSYNFNSSQNFFFSTKGGGISIRYTFGKGRT